MTLPSESAMQLRADIAYMETIRRKCPDNGILRVVSHYIWEAKQKLEEEEQTAIQQLLQD